MVEFKMAFPDATLEFKAFTTPIFRDPENDAAGRSQAQEQAATLDVLKRTDVYPTSLRAILTNKLALVIYSSIAATVILTVGWKPGDRPSTINNARVPVRRLTPSATATPAPAWYRSSADAPSIAGAYYHCMAKSGPNCSDIVGQSMLTPSQKAAIEDSYSRMNFAHK